MWTESLQMPNAAIKLSFFANLFYYFCPAGFAIFLLYTHASQQSVQLNEWLWLQKEDEEDKRKVPQVESEIPCYCPTKFLARLNRISLGFRCIAFYIEIHSTSVRLVNKVISHVHIGNTFIYFLFFIQVCETHRKPEKSLSFVIENTWTSIPTSWNTTTHPAYPCLS